MDLVGKLALLLTPGFVQGPGAAPSDTPSSPTIRTYGSPNLKWRVSWTNGDPVAYTRIYRGAVGGNFAGSAQQATKNPGITSHDTNDLNTTDFIYYFTHFLNAQESGEVSAETGGAV